MKRMLVLSIAACAVLTAQQVVPSFQLSEAEAANAKQLTEAMKSAKQRSDDADKAWGDYFALFRASHPELGPNMQFTSDFRLAIAYRQARGMLEATGVELAPAETKKAESLYREMQESRRAFIEARKNWAQFEWDMVAKYVPQVEPGKGKLYESPAGMRVEVPAEWSRGIVVVMPDCRAAIPG